MTIRRLVVVLAIMSLGWGEGAWAHGAATPRPPLTPPQRMASVLYVGNVFTDTVTALDAVDGTLITKIGVASPSALALTPDGKTLFAASSRGVYESGSVFPIDTATHVRGIPIPVGVDPQGLAVTPNGRTVYVANANSNTVTPVDVATLVPGPPIAVGRYPKALALTADGGTVYVANRNSYDVSRIDTATNSVVGQPIPVPQGGVGPQSMAMLPDSSKLYVDAASSIAVIDTTTNAVQSTIPVVDDEHFGLAVSHDGKRIVSTNFFAGSVQVIDSRTNRVGRPTAVTEPGFGGALEVAIDSRGTAYVVTRSDAPGEAGAVVPVDLTGMRVGPPIATHGHGSAGIALRNSTMPNRSTCAAHAGVSCGPSRAPLR